MNRFGKISKRKAVNLSADAALVEDARSMGMNLSLVFEASLKRAVSEERKRQWVEENREAIDEYNARIDQEGTFAMKFWGR